MCLGVRMRLGGTVTRCSSARSTGLAGAPHLVHSSITLPHAPPCQTYAVPSLSSEPMRVPSDEQVPYLKAGQFPQRRGDRQGSCRSRLFSRSDRVRSESRQACDGRQRLSSQARILSRRWHIIPLEPLPEGFSG